MLLTRARVRPSTVTVSPAAKNWQDRRGVAAIDGAELKRAAARLAACALLARACPQQGGRNEGAIVVAGFLCRCGFAAPDIKLFVDALAGVTCQPPDKRRDMVRAAADTAAAFAAGRNTFGLPKMIEVFGEPVAKKCVQWLGYRPEVRGANGERAAEARTTDGFVRGDAGQILKGHPENIRHAVQALGVSLRLNQFSVQTDVAGLDGHGPELDDAGAVRLRLLTHEVYGFLPTQELFEQVLVDMAHANRFHPSANISKVSNGIGRRASCRGFPLTLAPRNRNTSRLSAMPFLLQWSHEYSSLAVSKTTCSSSRARRAR